MKEINKNDIVYVKAHVTNAGNDKNKRAVIEFDESDVFPKQIIINKNALLTERSDSLQDEVDGEIMKTLDDYRKQLEQRFSGTDHNE